MISQQILNKLGAYILPDKVGNNLDILVKKSSGQHRKDLLKIIIIIDL